MGKFHVKAGHSRKLGQEKGEKSGTSRQKRDSWQVWVNHEFRSGEEKLQGGS